MPVEYVSPRSLKKVAEHGSMCSSFNLCSLFVSYNIQFTLGPSKLYGCEVSRSDHLERRDGGKFDAQEYDDHPERYISTFSKKIAPYASGMLKKKYYTNE